MRESLLITKIQKNHLKDMILFKDEIIYKEYKKYVNEIYSKE